MAFEQVSHGNTGHPPRRRDPDARHPVMLRCPPDILRRVDAAARRMGQSRAAFLVLCAVEKLERMEG